MRATSTSTGLVHEEHGIALIAALMIMLLMSALMIGFTTVVMSDQRYRGIDKDRARAYYGAQSGLEKLTTDLGNLFLTNVAPTNAQIAALANTPPTIPSVTFVAPAGVTAYGITPVAFSCNGVTTFTCSAPIQNGPYQGLMALKKTYNLDSVARTASGGEAHLMRKVESVAIPVFQFGMFSDVDLAFFAGPNFNFGGRVHTNGNLFLAEGGGATLTLTDKVTAVKEIVRQVMQNGVSINTAATHNGTVNMATGTNSFRALLATEGSVNGGLAPPAPNTSWPGISLGGYPGYSGYIRNGTTGAKVLNLPLITGGVAGQNTDLTRRPPPNEDTVNPVLFGERLFGKVSVRILLSDTAADITNLPTVTATAPVHLGDEGVLGAGLTNDWKVAAPAGYTVDATHPPIARSPGLQNITTTAPTAANAATISVNVAALAPGSVYNSPATLTFDVIDPLVPLVPIQTVLCQIVTSTQFQTCSKPGGGNLLAVPAGYLIKIKDGSSNTQTFTVTAAVAGAATQTFTVANTAAAVANTFWMQSSADQSWSVVTCTGVNSNLVAGGAVVRFQNCSGVPQTVAAANGITTNALVAQNVGTTGGYLKIEIQRADFTWQDVTMEILNYGFGAPNQAGTNCGDPTPNAIIRLQRLRDNANACTYANSTNSYDYWPNTIFDVREALFRDAAPANRDVKLGGVMHYISIDVGNLSKWLQGTAPYGAGSGINAYSNNGYGVYFSDRRNNRDLNNLETGEYGFEDFVNPLSATGTPSGGTPDTGEDVNANAVLDVYGQDPNFIAVRNALPPGPIAPFDVATSIRPWTPLGRSAAMTSRAYIFRRALKLTNGGLGNIVMPGLTFVTENPVYIQGDWNWASGVALTNPHAATSVIADSVTLLSGSWTDANSYVNPYTPGNRTRAAPAWYRLGIIAGKGMAFPWPSAGNPPNDFGTDGGAHNFLRYLESGSTVNYRGAIATFYYNREAVGTYKCCNTVYGAPTRNYNFDTDFLDPAKLPPLTPVFRDINALGFAQEIRPGK